MILVVGVFRFTLLSQNIDVLGGMCVGSIAATVSMLTILVVPLCEFGLLKSVFLLQRDGGHRGIDEDKRSTLSKVNKRIANSNRLRLSSIQGPFARR